MSESYHRDIVAWGKYKSISLAYRQDTQRHIDEKAEVTVSKLHIEKG